MCSQLYGIVRVKSPCLRAVSVDGRGNKPTFADEMFSLLKLNEKRLIDRVSLVYDRVAFRYKKKYSLL